jgi:hypothetical protein
VFGVVRAAINTTVYIAQNLHKHLPQGKGGGVYPGGIDGEFRQSGINGKIVVMLRQTLNRFFAHISQVAQAE